MRYAAKLVLRGGQPHEATAVANVLAAAFAGGDVDRWVGATAHTRNAHFRTVVESAFAAGVVRVADEDGTLVGAALWFRHDANPAPPRASAEPVATVGPDASAGLEASDGPETPTERLALLERLLAD